MVNIKDLKKGSILSENSFFVVEKVIKNGVIVKDEFGNEVEIGKEYVENLLASADSCQTESKVTVTELADIVKNNPRIAMTVAFYKKDVTKTKKVYNAEVNEAIEKVRNAKVSEVEPLLRDLVENPISKVIPGELRVMKGRHYGHIDDMGRLHFVDMEQVQDPKRSDDSRMRQVDPRTLQYVIVNNVKYSLK